MKPMTEQGKSIFNLLKSGNGFSNPLITGAAVLGGTVAVSEGLSKSLHSVSDPTTKDKLIAAGLTEVVLQGFTSTLGKSTEATKTLTEYGQKSVDEFSSRMQVAKSYQNVMGAAGEQTGCSPFSGVMGVATEAGHKAMDTLNSALDSANETLQELQDAIDKGTGEIEELASKAATAISEATSKVEEYASSVTSMIEDELAEIADYLKTNIHGFLAGVLPDWFDDTCKSGIVDSIATPEMKEALKS